MKRDDRLLSTLKREDKLIEIGGSHAPVVPKRGGWQTCVVDHATRADLTEKYKYQAAVQDLVEEVDVVWDGSDLHERFSAQDHGSFDAIIASHVLEHIPNPIAFLRSCEILLKPGGRVILALPDKRRCFDFFGSVSTTGEFISAFLLKERTHSVQTAFNYVAYSVLNEGQIGWSAGPIGKLSFVHALELAQGCALRAVRSREYFDFHAWRFVPSSFALIILELCHLKYLSVAVENLSETVAQEFFVDLVFDRQSPLSIEDVNKKRIALLSETLLSAELQIREFRGKLQAS